MAPACSKDYCCHFVQNRRTIVLARHVVQVCSFSDCHDSALYVRALLKMRFCHAVGVCVHMNELD